MSDVLTGRSAWTPAVLDRFKAHWAAGLSSSEIAAELNREFGVALTRGAILGKADRIGLSRRDKVVYRAPRKQRCTFVVPHPVKRAKPQDELPPDTETVAAIERAARPAAFLGIALVDLEPHHCRYPRGGNAGEPILFCGQPKLAGSSYCEPCGRRCYGGERQNV